MKTLFTQQARYQFSWYRFVLFFVFIILTGIYHVNGQTAGAPIKVDNIDDLPKSGLAGENLTPYQPGGWDNKLVVSTTTGTSTSASVIYPSDNLYVDWAVVNNGTTSTPPSVYFYTRLYVDNVLKNTWPSIGVNSGYYVYISDYLIGSLTPGYHTIRIVTDATGVITETNETDNEFSRVIYVRGPNLIPFQPSGWDNRIVVSTVTGTYTSSSTIFNTQAIYVDWAITNSGNYATTTTFVTRLFVDDVLRNTWPTYGLGTGAWVYIADYNIGTLTPGNHTIKIVTDATGVVPELSETDNEYSRIITSIPEANLTPYQHYGWDNKIVVSTATGTNTSASVINPSDNLYIDWAVINNGTSGTPVGIYFYTRLYVDGVLKNTWPSIGVNSGQDVYIFDYPIGPLSPGYHILLIVTDATGAITETNETDNEFSRSIYVSGPNLTPIQPSGWDNKLVVSTVTGTNTSSSTILNTQRIYVDWAIRNIGSLGTSTTFYTRLYVDDFLSSLAVWPTYGLGSGEWVYITDYNIGLLLAPGNHTIRIVTDATGAVTETSETDNEYTRTITVSPADINLTFYQPSGWDNKLVLSTVTGTNTSASVINNTQPIYLDWAAINNGTDDIIESYMGIVRLYIDGVNKWDWSRSGFPHGEVTYCYDYNVGTLPSGTHTFRIVLDVGNGIQETNEGDNEYILTKTIDPVFLNVSPTNISIGSAIGSTGTFNITSNTNWSISEDAAWLSVSPASGSNNATIVVAATSANLGPTPRTDTVTIAATGVSTKSVAVTQQIQSGGTKTLGNTTVYGSTSTTANRRAETVTFPEAGTIQSISIYHNGGTGSVLLGVYADGGGAPGTRLGVTPSTIINASAGWQTISLTSPVSVTSGQKVWLSWVFQTNPGIRYVAGTPARAESPALWSGGMPSTFGTASFANYKYSLYCTYTTGAAPPTKTLGNTTVYGSTSTTANRRAQTVTFPEAGTIQSLSIYHNGGTGHVLLGVYADASGAPGARFGVTPSTVINASAGWQTISLTSPVSVTSGQKIWLSWVFENNPGIRYVEGTPARAESPALWSGGMPSTFGTASFANYKYSLYCTYTTGVTPPTKTLGNTTVYGSTSTTANRRDQTVTFPEAGTIQSLSIYHNGGTGHVLLGVYADASGAPGARLGVTPSTIINASAGWQTISLTSPVSVISGQKVWLAWVFESNPGIRYITGTPARAQSAALWAGGMPDPFGTSTFANYKYSVYCTYTTSGGDEVKSLNEPLDVQSMYMDKEEVLIYPNPTEGDITVIWKNRYSHRLDITIYNILGKAVKEVQTDPDVNEIRLDMNGTSNGVYLFEMKDKKNDLILNRSRIIKK